MAGAGKYYSVFWRWHFYAGLIVAPFLLILSLTGMIYLFNNELNDWIYPELRFASSRAAAQPVSKWLDSVSNEYPGGKAAKIYLPVTPGGTAEIFVTTARGENRRVFIDPPTAKVLGSYIYTQTLVGFADVMHGSLMLGSFGSAVMELAACWALIMIFTGFYLWFPRLNSGGTWLPRFSLKGRRLWKDVHKITGLYAAVFIVFLIISGMPWTDFWGAKWLTPITNSLGLGYPKDKQHHGSATATSHVQHDVPWTLQQAPLHVSMRKKAPISVDEAVGIFAAHGMAAAYRLTLPVTEDGVFMGITYPNQPEGQRTLQIDQYSGKVLGDVGFEDYGAVAKLVEWGVALHMGNYFGIANQIIMLIPCLAIIALITTGFIMWWKRRPRGELGAPKLARPVILNWKMKLAILCFGLIFPLTGASILLVWLLDRLIGCKRHEK